MSRTEYLRYIEDKKFKPSFHELLKNQQTSYLHLNQSNEVLNVSSILNDLQQSAAKDPRQPDLQQEEMKPTKDSQLKAISPVKILSDKKNEPPAQGQQPPAQDYYKYNNLSREYFRNYRKNPDTEPRQPEKDNANITIVDQRLVQPRHAPKIENQSSTQQSKGTTLPLLYPKKQKKQIEQFVRNLGPYYQRIQSAATDANQRKKYSIRDRKSGDINKSFNAENFRTQVSV